MKWRSLPNGDKFSPRRGTPVPPDGYCLDPRDKYLAHPILENCQYRFITKETLSCGKILGVIGCSEPSINQEVTQMQCFTCPIGNAKKIARSQKPPVTNVKEESDVSLPEELIDLGLPDSSTL